VNSDQCWTVIRPEANQDPLKNRLKHVPN
jgi:hypothetical protein